MITDHMIASIRFKKAVQKPKIKQTKQQLILKQNKIK
jgi:hypothetical protein